MRSNASPELQKQDWIRNTSGFSSTQIFRDERLENFFSHFSCCGDFQSMGEKESPTWSERKMTMRTNPIPGDADELVALAQSIATVLSEKRDELGINTDFEALLRVSIAAAKYAIDRYVAVL